MLINLPCSYAELIFLKVHSKHTVEAFVDVLAGLSLNWVYMFVSISFVRHCLVCYIT